MRVPVLPSSGPAESAHLIYAAARQCQAGKAHSGAGYAAHGSAAGRHRATQPEQQMQVVLSLPGIGPVTARPLCAIPKPARPAERRRRSTVGGTRYRALARRYAGTVAACDHATTACPLIAVRPLSFCRRPTLDPSLSCRPILTTGRRFEQPREGKATDGVSQAEEAGNSGDRGKGKVDRRMFACQ